MYISANGYSELDPITPFLLARVGLECYALRSEALWKGRVSSLGRLGGGSSNHLEQLVGRQGPQERGAKV